MQDVRKARQRKVREMNTTQRTTTAVQVTAGASVRLGGVWFDVVSVEIDPVSERPLWTLREQGESETFTRDMAPGMAVVVKP